MELIFDDPLTADLTLRTADGGSFAVHRKVLEKNKYFEGTFRHEPAVKVVQSDFTSAEVEVVLRWIYGESFDLPVPSYSQVCEQLSYYAWINEFTGYILAADYYMEASLVEELHANFKGDAFYYNGHPVLQQLMLAEPLLYGPMRTINILENVAAQYPAELKLISLQSMETLLQRLLMNAAVVLESEPILDQTFVRIYQAWSEATGLRLTIPSEVKYCLNSTEPLTVPLAAFHPILQLAFLTDEPYHLPSTEITVAKFTPSSIITLSKRREVLNEMIHSPEKYFIEEKEARRITWDACLQLVKDASK